MELKDLIIAVETVLLLYLLYKDKFDEWKRLRRIKQFGDVGEKAVSDSLGRLEDVFAIYHSLQGRFENQSYEIDHLLLTHHGIILIETKNIRGTILARKDIWVQIKDSEAGKSYEREIRSPIRQIERTSRIFENFVYDCGFRVKVQPVVVFSSPDAVLKLPPQKYPVMILSQMDEFVKSMSRDVPLTTRQLRSLKEMLDKVYHGA